MGIGRKDHNAEYDMANLKSIQAAELANVDLYRNVIIDVRTQMEYDEKRLKLRHAFMPLDALQPGDFMLRHGLDRDAVIYTLCASGRRAVTAAEKFIAEGFNNVYVVEGGLIACQNAGLPLEGNAVSDGVVRQASGKISLERQIRILAGSLVALGAALGLWVNSSFVWLSLFVGCGLVFAGITNWCGMGLLLAKAPWNKAQGASCQVPGPGGACGIGSKPPAGSGQSCQ